MRSGLRFHETSYEAKQRWRWKGHREFLYFLNFCCAYHIALNVGFFTFTVISKDNICYQHNIFSRSIYGPMSSPRPSFFTVKWNLSSYREKISPLTAYILVKRYAKFPNKNMAMNDVKIASFLISLAPIESWVCQPFNDTKRFLMTCFITMFWFAILDIFWPICKQ